MAYTIRYEGRIIGYVHKDSVGWRLTMCNPEHPPTTHKTRKSAIWLANFLDAGDIYD